MILIILGYTFIALVLLVFAGLALREFVARRMSESFDLGMKLGTIRAQIAPDLMDEILRDAGIDPVTFKLIERSQ